MREPAAGSPSDHLAPASKPDAVKAGKQVKMNGAEEKDRGPVLAELAAKFKASRGNKPGNASRLARYGARSHDRD
jgi:hypothetical protein